MALKYPLKVCKIFGSFYQYVRIRLPFLFPHPPEFSRISQDKEPALILVPADAAAFYDGIACTVLSRVIWWRTTTPSCTASPSDNRFFVCVLLPRARDRRTTTAGEGTSGDKRFSGVLLTSTKTLPFVCRYNGKIKNKNYPTRSLDRFTWDHSGKFDGTWTNNLRRWHA